MPLSWDYVWLPTEVLSRVVSYNIDPDIAPVKAYRIGDHTFTAPDVDLGYLSSVPILRGCALDTLRAARLVKLEYVGPSHLAPFHHCHLMTYSPDAPNILPYKLEISGTLHSAYVHVEIVHPDFNRSACIHLHHTLTMRQLAVYIRRMGNYACVSPPAFLTDTPEELALGKTRFSMKVDSHWLPIFPDIQHGDKFVGKDVVERSLVDAFLPLAPLISIEKGRNNKARSHVSMTLAADNIRQACRELGSNSSEVGTRFINWYGHMVGFFKSDFRAIRALYNRLVRDVTDGEEPVMRDMQPWTLMESHNASSRLYQLHAGLTDSDVNAQGCLLAPTLLHGAAVISMFRWRHHLVAEFSFDRTPICGCHSCPCSLISSDGLMDITLAELENGMFPWEFGIDLPSWSRVQHQVLLNHRLRRNCTRGDVARCVNDLTRLSYRMWNYSGTSWVRTAPLTSDVMDDIVTLTDIVKRWNEQKWDDESEIYDETEGGEDGSRLEYIFSRLRRANPPYRLDRRCTTVSTVATEKMYLPFT